MMGENMLLDIAFRFAPSSSLHIDQGFLTNTQAAEKSGNSLIYMINKWWLGPATYIISWLLRAEFLTFFIETADPAHRIEPSAVEPLPRIRPE